MVSVMNSFSRNMTHILNYNGHTFDNGIHHPWSTRLSERDPLLEGETWLFDQISKIKLIESHPNHVQCTIPLKHDGTEYCLSDLNNDQCKIAYVVMTTILQWFDYNNSHHKRDQNQIHDVFHPLRMTVSGKAGTGKTYLIQTIITMIRKFTGVNNSVILCAPTGKIICLYHLLDYIYYII